MLIIAKTQDIIGQTVKTQGYIKMSLIKICSRYCQYSYQWNGEKKTTCMIGLILFLTFYFFVMFLGVISVALKGESKNRIEVIGEGVVDAAGLAEILRKKVGYADLVSVQEVK